MAPELAGRRKPLTDTTEHREPIAASWNRSCLAGLRPGSALESLRYQEVDLGSSLMAAAAPILEDLKLRLIDTDFSTVLVDREARIAQLWCGTAKLERTFARIGLTVGTSMREEYLGTNAPGTALATRAGLYVSGPEHFAAPLRVFNCYGHPIFHPVTRKLEGVLNISGSATETNQLLQPLVAGAVAAIEQRLLDGSRLSEQELLRAFQVAARRRRPVVAVGTDVVIANEAALDLLGTTDTVVLRMLALDHGSVGSARELTLESGARVDVVVEQALGTHGGVLLRIEPYRRPATAEGRAQDAGVLCNDPILIAGGPGTGRSTHGKNLAGEAPFAVLTAAAALLEGTDAWARRFSSLIRAGQGCLCIDGLELLPYSLLDLVDLHAAAGVAPRLILVSGPVDELNERAAALAARCRNITELGSLAARIAELPALARAMLQELSPHRSLHLTPAAVAALSAQPWPGNLRELRSVLEEVTATRSAGGIAVEDLPERYRVRTATRTLHLLERAERDAIVAALGEHAGNKVHAAASLGISRTTLYAKMRTLRINSF
jgi:transcriptional regulator of acetoin/glycerol metabolism